MKIHLFLSVKEIDGNRTKENNDVYNLLCVQYIICRIYLIYSIDNRLSGSLICSAPCSKGRPIKFKARAWDYDIFICGGCNKTIDQRQNRSFEKGNLICF